MQADFLRPDDSCRIIQPRKRRSISDARLLWGIGRSDMISFDPAYLFTSTQLAVVIVFMDFMVGFIDQTAKKLGLTSGRGEASGCGKRFAIQPVDTLCVDT